ncbi:MAG: UDP-N-acetylmuramoyl-tripeptide--D-alanyl-D-alanine ligase [Syntrophomonadaceae bacterium]|nr:UDP-N-acetylmuramoyl-tripeptide--D-alanyl-D-alanine ligase [Syntrophomonadaceae bacterium]
MKQVVLKKPIIAVAGSSGKTTTKEMITSILKSRWKVYKSMYNRNNRKFMRIHAKSIRPFHKAAVLEFGMSGRGHLRQQCQIIKPNIAVITMVGTAHIGNFRGKLTSLIKAKSQLAQHMKRTGTLYLNADDINSKRLRLKPFRGTIKTVSIKGKGDYTANEIRYTDKGMSFNVTLKGVSHNFFIPAYGVHNVYNALFSIAVTDGLGFNASDIKAGLRNYSKPHRRLVVYRTKNKARIIDDTFNANPNSMKAAIDVLSNLPGHPKILVLGSMSELGPYSKKGHQTVGKYVSGKGIDYLLTFGKSAQEVKTTAVRHGFPPNRAIHALNRKSLHRQIKTLVKPDALILVKGSNNTRMNKTVSYLRKDKIQVN